MAKLYVFKCPDCEGEWEWLRHPSDEPFPKTCDLCGADMDDDGPPKAPVIKLNIGTAKNKVGDKLYRQMEASGEARAEAVREATGASAAEVAHMKVTDLPDNVHVGENSAKAFDQRAAAAQKQLSYNAMGRTIGPELQRMTQEQVSGMVEATTTDYSAPKIPTSKLATRQMIDSAEFKQTGARQLAAMTRRGTMGVDNTTGKR